MKNFLKRILQVTAIVLTVVVLGVLSSTVSTAIADNPYLPTLVARTAIIDYGTLAVTGASTFTSDVILTSGLFRGGSSVAKIDSGNALAGGSWTLDTVAMTGAKAGDVVGITEYLPNYSATPDTGAYYAYTIYTDHVVITRTKRVPASALKSYPKLGVVLISKQ